MIEAKEQGKVRSIGVSNFNQEHLQRLITETGVSPVLNQIELHPFFQQRSLREVQSNLNIKTQAWSPLGQGQALDNKEINTIARKHGRSPAQIILRWHLQLGNIVIPKSVTPQRISENLDVFNFELSDDEIMAIAKLDSSERIGPNPLDIE